MLLAPQEYVAAMLACRRDAELHDQHNKETPRPTRGERLRRVVSNLATRLAPASRQRTRVAGTLSPAMTRLHDDHGPQIHLDPRCSAVNSQPNRTLARSPSQDQALTT
jgi:hypothetical protein